MLPSKFLSKFDGPKLCHVQASVQASWCVWSSWTTWLHFWNNDFTWQYLMECAFLFGGRKRELNDALPILQDARHRALLLLSNLTAVQCRRHWLRLTKIRRWPLTPCHFLHVPTMLFSHMAMSRCHAHGPTYTPHMLVGGAPTGSKPKFDLHRCATHRLKID